MHRRPFRAGRVVDVDAVHRPRPGFRESECTLETKATMRPRDDSYSIGE